MDDQSVVPYTLFPFLSAVPRAARVLDEIEAPPTPPTVEEMRDKIIEQLSISKEHLLSHKRDAATVKDRQGIAYALAYIGYAIGAIGRALHRDHSTILHSISRVQANTALKKEWQHIAMDASPKTKRETLHFLLFQQVRRAYLPAVESYIYGRFFGERVNPFYFVEGERLLQQSGVLQRIVQRSLCGINVHIDVVQACRKGGDRRASRLCMVGHG